jgi:hypothetical protein
VIASTQFLREGRPPRIGFGGENSPGARNIFALDETAEAR